MSLLFLTNVLDAFQALDDAGRPLPHAVLTFWHSQTSTPAAVYADQELETELSDAQGRVTADANGVFPLIYIDPDIMYRVRLQTSDGVLRWDVDPYLCDCTEPPRLFRNPVHQALTVVPGLIPTFGPPPLPGARLIFTDANTGAPLRVWADAARQVPLRNPLPSNAAGIFPPVYLEDDVEYRVQLVAPDGTVIIDADPYECFCGLLLLTSRPYPIESLDALDAALSINRGLLYVPPLDAFDVGLAALGGVLQTILRSYVAPPEDAFDVGLAALGGELFGDVVTYGQYLPEALDVSLAALGGTLT